MIPSAGRHLILLVAVDPVAGLDLAEALETSGYVVTGPIGSTDEVETWLSSWNPALAILDLDVVDGAGLHLAQALRARNVPFLIQAERERDEPVPPILAEAPWLTKPVWHRDVIDTAAALVARARAASPAAGSAR